ncbi:MAG: DUF503 domain-containing protein [Pseudomonadota bacterium]
MVELRIEFRLGGCRSLKEKRQRLRGLRDRFGKQPNLAVVESNYADSHRRAQWSFVAAASALEVVEKQLAEIERHISIGVDAEIVSIRRLERHCDVDDSLSPGVW